MVRGTAGLRNQREGLMLGMLCSLLTAPLMMRAAQALCTLCVASGAAQAQAAMMFVRACGRDGPTAMGGAIESL